MKVLGYPINRIRNDFPILQQQIKGKSLVYFDNASTTQKPFTVIKTLENYYLHHNANVHRGVHTLSEMATVAYTNVRETVRQFINAAHAREIIFVRGTTEAINLVASSYGADHIQSGDEILVSMMEHHSNIVPWQVVCEKVGAKLKVIPVNGDGELDLEKYTQLITNRTKLVAVCHVSNAIGTINPIKNIISIAHAQQIPVLIDGAQAIQHMLVDVQDLDCDFYTFSAHKMYGPTGIGILYGKEKLLEKMRPYQTGGGMISQVSFEKTQYQGLPEKFEAGTPDVAGAIAFQAAINYLNQIGMEEINVYEKHLLNYAKEKLQTVPGLKIIGNAQHQAAVISFVSDYAHPHDIGTVLDTEGIAIRAGHHCAMPLMTHLNLNATARASFGIYNTKDEIDKLVEGLEKVRSIFGDTVTPHESASCGVSHSVSDEKNF